MANDSVPYALSNYIGKAISNLHDSNTADHKPTYQSEIDKVEKEHTAAYARGQVLIAKIPKADLLRCKRLYKERNKGYDYGMDELRYTYIGETYVLAPRYIGLINEVRKLKKILR